MKKQLNTAKFILLLLLHCLSIGEADARPPTDWPKDGVLIMPDMKSAPILSAIKNAQKSIDLTQYHLDDEGVINQLIDARKRGVQVRIILNKPGLFPPPFATVINEASSKKLAEGGIETHYLKDFQYGLVHYKFMIIDNDYALIQTFNFDPFNFNEARNFGITVENPKVIATLSSIFQNDYSGESQKNDDNALSFFEKDNLILGPQNQRKVMLQFLASAKKSIYIYQQDLSDPEVGELLRKAALDGKKVRILMTPSPFGGHDLNGINRTFIAAAGGAFRFKPKSELYIHAKVALIDPEDSGRMYVGSCNFWPEALGRNREIGIVTNNVTQVQRVFSVFNKDWDSSLSYDEASSPKKE